MAVGDSGVPIRLGMFLVSPHPHGYAVAIVAENGLEPKARIVVGQRGREVGEIDTDLIGVSMDGVRVTFNAGIGFNKPMSFPPPLVIGVVPGRPLPRALVFMLEPRLYCVQINSGEAAAIFLGGAWSTTIQTTFNWVSHCGRSQRTPARVQPSG